MKFWSRLYREDGGAETAEWLVIVALIIGVTVTIYTGILQEALSSAVAYISSQIPG